MSCFSMIKHGDFDRKLANSTVFFKRKSMIYKKLDKSTNENLEEKKPKLIASGFKFISNDRN